jgi:very-short-patch-repair endonuclease
MNEVDAVIAGIAESQFGVFSRAQASAAGLSEESMSRRAMGGSWERVFPSVYRLPGTTRTGRQRAMAAVLWAGDDAAISHTTAARLLHLDGTRSVALHITVPRCHGLRRNDLVVHRTGSSARSDLVSVDGIRCTSATRTIIDCAALLGDEQLEAAFEHARRMGLTSATALARRGEKLCGRGRPGSTRLGRLLAVQLRGERAMESRLEVKLARLLRKSSLPPSERQHPVGRFRLDFAWPAARVACECDGFEHHGDRLAWKRDRNRLATIEAAGWRIVHVTWADATREPGRTLDRLALALRAAAQARTPASARAARAGSSRVLVSNEIRWTRSP